MNDGFDNVIRRLNRISDNAKQLEGVNSVKVEDLMPPQYIVGQTKFSSVEEFMVAGGITAQEQLEMPEWDQFVAKETKFDSWEEMVKDAGSQWVEKKLMS